MKRALAGHCCIPDHCYVFFPEPVPTWPPHLQSSPGSLSGETHHCPLCCFQKTRQIVPRSVEQKEQSLACLSSPSDSKSLAQRPTKKETPQSASIPTHSLSLPLPSPPHLQKPSQWLCLRTPGRTVIWNRQVTFRSQETGHGHFYC